jgi:hypothetical protein
MMIKIDGEENLDPRQNFIVDFITQFQKTITNQNNYFIFALDGNEALSGNNKQGVKKLMDKCELADMYSTIHEDNGEFPTHENGSQRIDYVLCSRNVIPPYVTKCGYRVSKN